MNIRGTIIGIGAVLFLASCSMPPQLPVPTDAKPLEAYTVEEIETVSAELIKDMGMDEELTTRLQARLKELLADPEFSKKVKSPGVTGVAVFQHGGGGMIIGGGAGSGHARFNGEAEDIRFETRGFGVGGRAGGQNTQGLILSVGLEHEQKFPDRYEVVMTGGTMGKTSYMVGQGTPARGTHRVHFVGAGIGFGADAGVGKVSIRLVP